MAGYTAGSATNPPSQLHSFVVVEYLHSSALRPLSATSVKFVNVLIANIYFVKKSTCACSYNGGLS